MLEHTHIMIISKSKIFINSPCWTSSRSSCWPPCWPRCGVPRWTGCCWSPRRKRSSRGIRWGLGNDGKRVKFGECSASWYHIVQRGTILHKGTLIGREEELFHISCTSVAWSCHVDWRPAFVNTIVWITSLGKACPTWHEFFGDGQLLVSRFDVLGIIPPLRRWLVVGTKPVCIQCEGEISKRHRNIKSEKDTPLDHEQWTYSITKSLPNVAQLGSVLSNSSNNPRKLRGS